MRHIRTDAPAVGLIAALAAEARSLRALSRHARPGPAGSARVIVRRCGVGHARAERAARELVEEGATALVSWGTAAALRSGLAPGVVALPRRVQHGAHAPVDVDAEWHDRVRRRLEGSMPCTIGVLAEVAEPLGSPAQKAQAQASTGAEVADMESAAVAAVALSAGLPFLVIRTISDDATRGVPRAALAALTEEGGVRAGAFVAALCRAPGELLDVARLAFGFGIACRCLARVARLAGREIAAPPAGDTRRRGAGA